MPCLPLTVIVSVASNKWDSSQTANDLLDCTPWEGLEDAYQIADKYRLYYSFSRVCKVQIVLSNKWRVSGFWGFFLVAI